MEAHDVMDSQAALLALPCYDEIGFGLADPLPCQPFHKALCPWTPRRAGTNRLLPDATSCSWVCEPLGPVEREGGGCCEFGTLDPVRSAPALLPGCPRRCPRAVCRKRRNRTGRSCPAGSARPPGGRSVGSLASEYPRRDTSARERLDL